MLMGYVKIGHWIAGEGSHSKQSFYFPNVDVLEREEDKVSGADSGDDSDDYKIAEVGCEVGIVEGHLCSIPYELYDLLDLKEILSLETWNSCLTDEERFSLSAYLPDMDRQTFWMTMKELLGSDDMFFGSPLAELFERLKSGFYPTKVTYFREGLQFLQRRTYQHLLRSYHENMVQTFLDMKKVWNQCQPCISAEERVYIWKTRTNNMGMDPLDLNANPVDGYVLSKEVDTKAIMRPLLKKTNYVGSKGAKSHLLPPVANGMKLVSNTSAKGILRIKQAGMNVFQTHIAKSVSSDNWAQHWPAPKGVLKILPKGLSSRQEQLRAMPVRSEANQLSEAPVLQMSRFSTLPAFIYRRDAGNHGEELPFLHQTVGNRKAYRSPELPDCIMDQQRVEFLNSTTGPSKNSESSIRKLKRVKDLPYDSITDVQEHNLFGGDSGPWNIDEGRGHGSSKNSVGTRRYACESGNLWLNMSRENRESSQSSLEPYPFSTECYQQEQYMAPMQEHLTMYPRTSEVVSGASDTGIRECEMFKASLDRTKRHKDVSVGESHKPYDQPTVSEGLRDGAVFPITYKRRKAQTKLNSLDFVKPLTPGADFKSTTPKEENHHVGVSSKAVKIKFKNWRENL